MSQEWALTPGYAQPKRKGKAAIITGAVLLGVAVVMGIVGAVGIANGVSKLGLENAQTAFGPATLDVQLEGGSTYVVYEFGTISQRAGITPNDVSVTDPSGNPVAVRGMGDIGQSFNDGANDLSAVAQFSTTSAGNYSVAVATEGAEFMVGPSITSFIGLGLFGLAIAFAVLLGIAGLIVLIVGLVRRASSKPQVAAYPAGAVGAGYGTPAQPYVAPAQTQQPQIFEQAPAEQQQPFASPAAQQQPFVPPVAPAPALPPAGWYPDPGRPGGQRYWDGQQWTEHQA